MSKELAQQSTGNNHVSIFSDPEKFDHWQRMAKVFNSSTMVPDHFKGETNMGNTLIVLNMAQRTKTDPFLLMQNIDAIKGKMALSSKYLIAQINASGLFSALRFEMENRGEKSITVKSKDWNSGQYVNKTYDVIDVACRAHCIDLKSKEKLVGSWVSIEMAVNEGWYTKNGSKWKTMSEQMLRYRAASFWASIYHPGAKLGMATAEEVSDTVEITPIEDITQVEDLNALVDKPEPAQQQPTKTIEIIPNEPAVVEAEIIKPKAETVTDSPPEPPAETVEDAGDKTEAETEQTPAVDMDGAEDII